MSGGAGTKEGGGHVEDGFDIYAASWRLFWGETPERRSASAGIGQGQGIPESSVCLPLEFALSCPRGMPC